ncbi:hypothetical protein HWV62_566 [Athelia sp. TMB]|nr:hypothetical protein HWV62_566 [Athelia sp. TMB]
MAPPPPVDINNLAAPAGSTHYVHQSINIVDQAEIKAENVKWGTITWTADVHVYPTGASLEDSDYWKRHGEVHVMVVHRGKIVHSTLGVKSLSLKTAVNNPGAQAKIQLPPTNSGVEDENDTHYKTAFTKRLPLYNGTQPHDTTVSIEKTFTRSGYKQESSVAGNSATIKLVPNSGLDILGLWGREQDIYGLSHFTLATGDYHDIDLCNFVCFSRFVLYANLDGAVFQYRIDLNTGSYSSFDRDKSVQVDPIPGLSVEPYKFDPEIIRDIPI